VLFRKKNRKNNKKKKKKKQKKKKTNKQTKKNNIIPFAIGRQRLFLNRFKYNKYKSVNAEITVRRASRARATNIDHNFVT